MVSGKGTMSPPLGGNHVEGSGSMPKVKKLAHVVLAVKDAQKSMDWYADVLGMEPVRYLEGPRLGLLTFGEQHHDIGLMTAPEGPPLGSQTGAHVAFEIEGGMDELKA